MKLKKIHIIFLFILFVMIITFFLIIPKKKSTISDNEQRKVFKHVIHAGSVSQNEKNLGEGRKMKFVLMSDTHGRLYPSEFLPEGDVFLFSGDFSNYDRVLVDEMKRFNEWMTKLPFQHKLVVAGNHDQPIGNEEILNNQFYENILTCCTYLHGKSVVLYPGNIKIYGTSLSPNMFKFLEGMHPDWESYDDRYYFRSEEKLMEIFSKIPEDTNMLLSHIPPYKIMDFQNGYTKGSTSLKYYIENGLPELKAHIFGHIHHQGGFKRMTIGEKEVLFINTAIDEREVKGEKEMETARLVYTFDYYY